MKERKTLECEEKKVGTEKPEEEIVLEVLENFSLMEM